MGGIFVFEARNLFKDTANCTQRLYVGVPGYDLYVRSDGKSSGIPNRNPSLKNGRIRRESDIEQKKDLPGSSSRQGQVYLLWLRLLNAACLSASYGLHPKLALRGPSK